MSKKHRRPPRGQTERTIRSRDATDDEKTRWKRAVYEGSPFHKRNPGDFGLTPPSNPRRDATLCDDAKLFKKSEAQELLEAGIARGVVSEATGVDDFPRHVWAVRGDAVFEAKLGGSRNGCYHGYPIRREDPLYEEVMQRWSAT